MENTTGLIKAAGCRTLMREYEIQEEKDALLRISDSIITAAKRNFSGIEVVVSNKHKSAAISYLKEAGFCIRETAVTADRSCTYFRVNW